MFAGDKAFFALCYTCSEKGLITVLEMVAKRADNGKAKAVELLAALECIESQDEWETYLAELKLEIKKWDKDHKDQDEESNE